MKVSKTDPAQTPAYPTRQQFLRHRKIAGAAALALGAWACGAQADNLPKPLAGVPLQEPKPVKQSEPVKEGKLLGEIAVEPVRLRGRMPAVTNAPVAPTNTATTCATTNVPPSGDTLRLKGGMPLPRVPGEPAGTP